MDQAKRLRKPEQDDAHFFETALLPEGDLRTSASRSTNPVGSVRSKAARTMWGSIVVALWGYPAYGLATVTPSTGRRQRRTFGCQRPNQAARDA